MDNRALYCASENLYTSLAETTAFCVITGTYVHTLWPIIIIAINNHTTQEWYCTMLWSSLPYSGYVMCWSCFGDWSFHFTGEHSNRHLNWNTLTLAVHWLVFLGHLFLLLSQCPSFPMENQQERLQMVVLDLESLDSLHRCAVEEMIKQYSTLLCFPLFSSLWLEWPF